MCSYLPLPRERFIRFRCQLNRKRVTSFKRRRFVALYYPVVAGSAGLLFEFDVLVLRYNLSQWMQRGWNTKKLLAQGFFMGSLIAITRIPFM